MTNLVVTDTETHPCLALMIRHMLQISDSYEQDIKINIQDHQLILTTKNNLNILIINSLPKNAEIISRQYPLVYDYVILLTDIKGAFGMLKNIPAPVITYGLNSKASITASSIAETTITCCVQRSFLSHKGETIDQQEFIVHCMADERMVLSVLCGLTVALVADVPPALLNEIDLNRINTREGRCI